jgi:hypothetical protein
LAAGRPGTPSEGLIYVLSAGAGFDLACLARFNLAWVIEEQKPPTGGTNNPQ